MRPQPLRRHTARKSTAGLCFENLETRQLMSAAMQLPNIAADRVDHRLWQAVTEVAQGKQSRLVQDRIVRFDAAGEVQTHIRAADVDAAAAQLRALGVKVEAASHEVGVVQAWISPDKMDDALAITGVSSLDLPVYAITNVTSAGDSVLKADQVRANFAAQGFTGTGIKVGVISDGANHRANVAAELSAVTVDPGRPGNGDEGTAMLEIVHDLAPGAQLYFSGPATNVDMVASINYLVAQGCNVIVDDLGFLGEHYFSDTSVANAAKNAVSQGVVYVTSAGNFGSEQHYQANYLQGLSATGNGRLHQFGTPGQDTSNVTIPNGQRFRAFLEWSDAWGNSSNDYDLFLYNANTLAQLDSGANIQNGNDLPFEFVDWTNNTGATVTGQLWINRKTGSAARELELFTIGNTSMQFDTATDQLFGQEAVPEVMSVGAVAASSPNSIESFSSRGGSSVYTDFAAQTKTTRQSLDAVATDGVQTAVGAAGFFFNPFFGTSAAAPHAAAIAALVRQANPSLTPAQVAQYMADTATDLGSAGYDTTFGAGRYNALDAVYKAFTPATPDLPAAADTGASNTDNLTSLTSFSLTGAAPAGAFVELFVDGIFKGSTQLAAGVTTWSITPAGGVGAGTHQATVRMSSSNTTLAANRSSLSAPLTIVVDTTKPTSTTKVFEYDTAQQQIRYVFSENVNTGIIDPGDLLLHNDTNNTNVSLTDISNTPTGQTQETFRFPTLINGVLTDGNYTASLSGVTDLAGNAMNADPFTFFVLAGDANRDRSVNLADFTTLAANFGQTGRVFSQGDFNYDGTVALGDFTILAAQFGKNLAPAGLPRGVAMSAGNSPFANLPIGESLIDDLLQGTIN